MKKYNAHYTLLYLQLFLHSEISSELYYTVMDLVTFKYLISKVGKDPTQVISEYYLQSYINDYYEQLSNHYQKYWNDWYKYLEYRLHRELRFREKRRSIIEDKRSVRIMSKLY